MRKSLRTPSGFGTIIWSRSDWDSKVLGFEVGRIDFLGADCSDVKPVLVKHVIDEGGFRLIFCRRDADDRSGISALQLEGFYIVDSLLEFELDTETKLAVSKTDWVIKSAVRADIPILKEIARSSFEFDRYHADPNIPKSLADEVKARWVEDSVLGDDTVWVAALNHRVGGFLTCERTGKIGLVAVQAEERGKGAAGALLQVALAWFKGQVPKVKSVTQFNNIPAVRMYLRAGFVPVGAKVTLHRWLPS